MFGNSKGLVWIVLTVGLALAVALLLADWRGAGTASPDVTYTNAEIVEGTDPPALQRTIDETPTPSDPDCFAPAALHAMANASTPASVARTFVAQLDLPERERQGPLIADLAGVHPFPDKDLLGRSRLERLVPPPSPGVLTGAQAHGLEAALAAPTLDGLLVLAYEAPLALRLQSGGFDGAEQSGLVRAMRTRTGEFWRRAYEIPASAFGLHELAAAIAQGVDVQHFVDILELSGVDATATWRPYQLGRDYNLAGVAAVHVRPRILSALAERGVKPLAGYPSVLDELAWALPVTRPDPIALRDVTLQLAAGGLRPHFPSTSSRLARVVPDIVVPAQQEDSEAAMGSSTVADNAKQLAALLERAQATSAEAARLKNTCQEAWIAAGATDLQDDNSPRRDLAVKMAQQEALDAQARLKEGELTSMAQQLPDEMSLEFLEAARSLGSALSDELWDAVPALCEDVIRTAPEALADLHLEESLINYVLGAGMPPGDALRELTSRLGGMPPDAIMTVVLNDLEREAIVALESHGLDPRFSDANGRNAINRLMDLYRRYPPSDDEVPLRWLDYLTSRSVSPSAGRGLDPLDTVLFAFLDTPTSNRVPSAITLAQALIRAGAPVGSSHREIADRIRAMAPQAYAELVAAIPQLG